MLKANSFLKTNLARRVMWIPLAFMLSLITNTGFAQQPCDFTFSLATEVTSCAYQFTSQVKGVPGLLLSHQWFFGDGSSSTVANPVHTYPALALGGGSQTYTVTHIVTTTNPFTNEVVVYSCMMDVTAQNTGTCLLCPPVNEVGALFNYQVDGCTITAQANVSGNFTVTWNMGPPDNTILYGTPITHTFAADGVYTVSMGASLPYPPYTSFRCQRKISIDCTSPNSDFTWTDGTGDCGCFGLEVFPVTIDPEAVYGWYVNGELVSTDVHPNLFPHGLDLCAIQQNGGKIKVSLVLQLDGESDMTTHEIDLSNASPAIYIGAGAGIVTKLSDYEDVLPGSSYCNQNCDVRVCGMIEVDKDFEFCGGVDVEVSAGLCGFEVNDMKTFSVTGASHLHGCDCLWQGITAKPGSTVRVNGNSIIEDAAYAIWTKFDAVNNLSANLWLNDADLKNNYVGVRVDGNLNLAEFTHNLFTSDKTLLNDCQNLLSGLGYTTAFGYAGMQIDHDGATMNLVNDGNQNIFSNLAVGIYSTDGTLNMAPCCSFQSLTNCTTYQGGAPAGAGGRGVWFVDNNAFSSTGNVFNQVTTGILGTTMIPTDITVTDNNMTQVSRGIDLRTSKSGRMSGPVNGNNITVNLNFCASPAFGIGFEDNTSGINNVDIFSNPINLNLGTNSYGIYLYQLNNIVNQLISTGPEVDVNNNPIILNSGTAGIHILTYHRSAVHSNTITIAGGSSPIGIFCQGYELFLNEGQNVICHNNITATTQNALGTGIWIAGSIDNIIQNNTMTHTSRSAFFHAECGWNTSFGCNTFAGAQFTGLQYSSTAHTGPQDNTGNAWTGTFINRALITPSPLLPNSVYTVPQGDPIHDPNNNQQWNGQQWFEEDPFIIAPDCPTSNCLGYNKPVEERQGATDGNHSSTLALQIAPNPNAGDFIVTFDKNPDDTAELQVISVSGALVKSYQVQPGESMYRISGMAPGIYFVKMTSNGKTSTPVKMVVF